VSASSEEKKAMVRRLIEGANNGDTDAAREVLAPDSVLHHPMLQEPGRGPEGFEQLTNWLNTVFSGFHTRIEFLLAEDDKVVSRWTVNGTHSGEFMGVPPTGRTVSYTGIACYRFAGDKVVEATVQEDVMGIMQQLGAF